MTKTKVFLLTFVITWMTAICLFDYYREDLCSQMVDNTLNDSSEAKHERSTN